MEKQLASKLFILDDYNSKENMEEHIKEYINKLKIDFPSAIVTREFYKKNGVLVRATQINYNLNKKWHYIEREDELEKEEVRIKERGINGLGENVYREKDTRHNGGNERERGIKLSAGQKQRLNLIRGILIDKDLYFFDEPTSNLDAVSEEKITNMIEKYLKDKTYVIVTHRPKLKELCNKHYVFENHMMKELIVI